MKRRRKRVQPVDPTARLTVDPEFSAVGKKLTMAVDKMVHLTNYRTAFDKDGKPLPLTVAKPRPFTGRRKTGGAS